MNRAQAQGTQTLVIEGSPGRLNARQIKEARQAMARLKFHPRESLPNATLLARAEALYLELTGAQREELGGGLASFRLALENQDEKAIALQRGQLKRLVDHLRSPDRG